MSALNEGTCNTDNEIGKGAASTIETRFQRNTMQLTVAFNKKKKHTEPANRSFQRQRMCRSISNLLPIPAAAKSKACCCGRSPAGTAGTNPAGCMDAIYCECCVLLGRSLCVGLITRPEESERVWCVWVWSWNLDNEEALAHKGLLPISSIRVICTANFVLLDIITQNRG